MPTRDTITAEEYQAALKLHKAILSGLRPVLRFQVGRRLPP